MSIDELDQSVIVLVPVRGVSCNYLQKEIMTIEVICFSPREGCELQRSRYAVRRTFLLVLVPVRGVSCNSQ